MSPREPQRARFAGAGLWLMAPGPAVDPTDLLDRATDAWSAAPPGTASLWVSESTGSAPVGAPYEAYSLLGALAVCTDEPRLGVVALGVERRAPSILAKIVTGVDVLSHGRAVLSLDADCGEGNDAERLSEALTVTRSVLEDEMPTFAGRIYSIEGAVNRPAPVQVGGIPVVVFLHGDGPDRRVLLAEAVRRADAVVITEGPEAVAEAVDEVNAQERTVEVVALVDGADDVSARGVIDDLSAAGATGVIVGVPWPWDTETIADALARG